LPWWHCFFLQDAFNYLERQPVEKKLGKQEYKEESRDKNSSKELKKSSKKEEDRKGERAAEKEEAGNSRTMIK